MAITEYNIEINMVIELELKFNKSNKGMKPFKIEFPKFPYSSKNGYSDFIQEYPLAISC